VANTTTSAACREGHHSLDPAGQRE